jgi:parallel beta-helix repeat protein
MFHTILRNIFKLKSKSKPGSRAKLACLRIEALEERAVPAVLTVGDPSGGKHNYPTITAALAAATINDKIDVYPGTYQEAVKVSTEGIQLIAEGSGVIIQPTSVSTVTFPGPNVFSTITIGGAAVDISAANVVVNGFTLDGSKDTDGNLWAAIRVIEGGTATIENDTVTGMVNGNTATDVAIQIGTSQLNSTQGRGTATVENNVVEDYAGAGIVVDGSTSVGTIKNNTVTGRGTGNAGISEYGIQVSNGGTAQITGNDISGNTIEGNVSGGYNPPTTSAGIFFYEDGKTASTATSNTLSGNDDGILVQLSNGTTTAAIKLSKNTVYDNFGYAGIFVLSSNFVNTSNNQISNNSTLNGIALNQSIDDTVSDNTISDNANADGIYDYQGAKNQITANVSDSNGDNGINIDTSIGDQLVRNTTSLNSMSGIQVVNGSTNTIKAGVSTDNLQDGIILIDTTQNVINGETLTSNKEYGVYLEDAQDSLIEKNSYTTPANGSGAIFIDPQSLGTVLKNNH